jgi:small GTP-binding protein
MKVETLILLYNIKMAKSIVAIGHVDHGKSALCGHLLYKCGYIDEHQMENIRAKAQKDNAIGQVWSRVFDIYEEEMVKGKTHEFDFVDFVYGDKSYRLIDTPGHQKFIRSMIEGLSNDVDIAMLLVSMKDNEFSSGFENGSVKEHLTLARAIGIKNLIIVCNKMDLIDWNEDAYTKKVSIIKTFLTKLSWPKDKIFSIPISAYQGTNLTTTENAPSWYKGGSLLGLIDSIEIVTSPSEGETKSVNKFLCDILVLNSANTIISPGYSCIMHYLGKETEVSIERLKSKKFLKTGEKDIVLFSCTAPIELSLKTRVILRNEDMTIGFGIVEKF